MIIVDTREQKYAHVLAVFEALGESYTRHKLDVGDYMIEDRPNRSVDRKQNIDEVAMNICTSSHRFWREVRRAKETGMELIVLVEDPVIRSFEQIRQWKSKYTRVNGMDVQREIFRLCRSYPNVRFEFCDPKETGKRIVEILKEE